MTRQTVALTPMRRKILAALATGPMTTPQVCDLIDRGHSATYQIMARLRDRGAVRNVGSKVAALWEVA